ncbi:adenylate/guanylate cyclase domain-containing protein [Rhizobium leguminosarum]|uniref:adenylate/guanylate cyclase domain-containing protein n=1 Tax=Rhizobium TaxID=379 RepID=UPI00102FF0F8|nr:adenylate/guanylate cyclase domain-containing protein [Rhizobium leguminosarum]TBF87414.1 adenylate/guanylate cyclase domain-containing protein [Rhizobium leguminosarum]TBG07029.1 adenylate/guanylate cyclase domain-containing protein [Rhizobium leguminosarum]TBG07821.1 adenylate/guanylate cyclase domain-containing protein [Rhizobium leguminosarum]TBG30720.1 adenylate/guanylate cyclase domain-containing protein [Rhizobium leguminosarum]TBG50120.1 adenylate/guanylate cyclase domain-containing
MDTAQISAINAWLIDQGLLGRSEALLLSGFCERCRNAGLPLVQAAIFFDTLHPVNESRGLYWDLAKSPSVSQTEYSRYEAEDNARRWHGSPFHHMLENNLAELHLPLDEANDKRFSILGDLREEGQSDYLALIHHLGNDEVNGEMDNIYSRWSTSTPGGFGEDDIGALHKLAPALALAIKSVSLSQTARALVEVYLGKDAGSRVLRGRIGRGRVESISAVLWFSDMENYTMLSEHIDSNELIPLLNDYSEAVISSVQEAGGDVLKLIGDGALALFRHDDATRAAEAALQAQQRLQTRLESLRDSRLRGGRPHTSIYVALHVGSVFYGNIGSDERLDFTVVGPAVNEVCRISSTCRQVGQSLLVSREFLDLLPASAAVLFRSNGTHSLKGVSGKRELFGY